MQDLTNNMDDLFRKAGEVYPLQQGEDRWAEIEAKLQASGMPPSGSSGAQKRNWRWGPFLGFFLFAFLVLTDAPVIEKAKLNGMASDTLKAAEKEQAKATFTPDNSKRHETVMRENAVVRVNKQSILKVAPEVKRKPVVDETTAVQREEVVLDFVSQQINLYVPPTELQREPLTLSIESKNNTTAPHKQTQRRFYYGFALGTNFCWVKDPAVQKGGFTAGVLAGYRFAPRLSAEAGLLYSGKKYLSNGAYFSMDEMGSSMPPDMKITEVKGQQHTVEIPLRVRYDVRSQKAAALFVTAGVVSRILTSETNEYSTELNGTAQSMMGYYKKVHYYPLATAELSAGYEIRHKRFAIRLEPFVQLPLQGVGIGAVPVSSAGFRLGITQ